VPTTDVLPVGATKFPATHEPAVVLNVEPVPREKLSLRPVPFVVSHVPEVSPGIEMVLYSHAFAEMIVYENT
jgi:hypothetical protein